MITIKNRIVKEQPKFWNNCVFHPTDAVEDAWGKRILDRMSKDKAIDTIRIYAMLEDIVYIDMNGQLAYDFRVSDLRLDYLVECGYNLIISYGGIPECISDCKHDMTSVSKNKTRYKGKMWNTSPPKDYTLWEEVCYIYTKHIVERYGIERVSEWRISCFNEPDLNWFFMANTPQENIEERVSEYCKLYEGFSKGIERVSKKIVYGGPAWASIVPFLEAFLKYVKENKIRLDFISMHNYGTDTGKLNKGGYFSVDDWIAHQELYMNILDKFGFSNTELIIDEWGMSNAGFYNIEECPSLLSRETEVFSAYYIKLIYKIIEKNWKISKLAICLSGQHEMTTDFSGFRNFFTLNFFAKPIYNAHILSSKLYSSLLISEVKNENLYVIPTKNENSQYAVLMSYSSEKFEQGIKDIYEELSFEENLKGKEITIYCIDKNTNNPYRLYEKEKMSEPLSEADILSLRKEGQLKLMQKFIYDGNPIKLFFSANSTYFVEVK